MSHSQFGWSICLLWLVPIQREEIVNYLNIGVGNYSKRNSDFDVIFRGMTQTGYILHVLEYVLDVTRLVRPTDTALTNFWTWWCSINVSSGTTNMWNAVGE